MYPTHVLPSVYSAMNVAAPGANTNAMPDLTWHSENPARFYIQLATGSVVNVIVDRVRRHETVTLTLGLNGNAALTAGGLYAFDVPLQNGDVVNYQVETDGIIQAIDIREVAR